MKSKVRLNMSIVGKISSPLHLSSLSKVRNQDEYFYNPKYFFSNGISIYYHNTPVNWIRSHFTPPYFKSERNGEGVSTQLKQMAFKDDHMAKTADAILVSTLYFIWWLTNSDCYHLNKPEIANFRHTYTRETAFAL